MRSKKKGLVKHATKKIIKEKKHVTRHKRKSKIIETFTTPNGNTIVFRHPKKNDLKKAWTFYNKVIKETNFLSRISPVTLAHEKKWLDNSITSMRKRNKVLILVEHNRQIIGSSDVTRHPNEANNHVGEFGVAILQEYTGLGIGKRLMKIIEKEAKKMDIEIIRLSVYKHNKVAQRLYARMGFLYAGEIPRAVKHGKKYYDDMIMYKVIG